MSNFERLNASLRQFPTSQATYKFLNALIEGIVLAEY
jgi:hypothetical protein